MLGLFFCEAGDRPLWGLTGLARYPIFYIGATLEPFDHH
jgi:hypothetical protein